MLIEIENAFTFGQSIPFPHATQSARIQRGSSGYAPQDRLSEESRYGTLHTQIFC